MKCRTGSETGPTAAELEKAKSYLIGNYALRFDASQKIARQLIGIQLDKLGIDYIDRRNDLIRAVTMDDVMRAAKFTMYHAIADADGYDKPDSAKLNLQVYHLFGDPMLKVRPPRPPDVN